MVAITGSREFKAAIKSALEMIENAGMSGTASRIREIREVRSDDRDRRHADVWNNGLCRIYPRGWKETDTEELASTIIHEATHLALLANGQENSGDAAEALCREAESKFRAGLYPAASSHTCDETLYYGEQSALPGYQIWDVPAKNVDEIGAPFTPLERAWLAESVRKDEGVTVQDQSRKLYVYAISADKGVIRENDGYGRILKMRR